MVKYYVSPGLFSHWRICFLLSSQTTHLRGPSGNHWKIILSVATLVLLGLPPPHCFLLFIFFSLHITGRLNFYKSYIHKTFLSLSWWEIRRACTPGLPGMENSIWETNILEVGTCTDYTMQLRWERQVQRKGQKKPSHRIWSLSVQERTRPKSSDITVISSELKQIKTQAPRTIICMSFSSSSSSLSQKATKINFYSPTSSRMICTYLP